VADKSETRCAVTTHAIGRHAERSAETWLHEHGLHTIARNYHAPFGEIDLIMLENDVLVFVEVRYRRGTRYGAPEETVHRTKQGRLIRTAQRFLQQHPAHRNRRCRFDVISITGRNYRPDVRWIKDAFTQ
jgi:putative endonuclease